MVRVTEIYWSQIDKLSVACHMCKIYTLRVTVLSEHFLHQNKSVKSLIFSPIYILYKIISFVSDAIDSSRAGNLTEYVTMPKPNASSPTLTPFDCSVFEDDSIAHQIRLRPNESAFYSVLPTFSVNNKSIVISTPWVSYKGMVL